MGRFSAGQELEALGLARRKKLLGLASGSQAR
jgi:hypothetical protein